MPARCCKEFFSNLPDDEPVFTLAAHDILAVETVWYWINRAKMSGVNADKLRRAEEHLHAMVQWRTTHPTKIPD